MNFCGSREGGAVTERKTDSRTVFVLGGGGALGAYQAGALLALLEHGVVPDAIYGASVGSLNGAYLAHDPTPARAAQLVGWWTGEQAREILTPTPWQRVRGLAAAFRGAGALFDERPLRRTIGRHVGAHDIAELAIPLLVTTTCLDCARPIQHSQGAIADVLVASCALPGLFPAVRLLDGHRHVDAGVLCGVPVRAAVDAAGSADRIFVLDCALAPVTSQAGCAATSAPETPSGRRCAVESVPSRAGYVAPVESFPGVLQAVLDSFAVARTGANVAAVGDSLADSRVQVAPHIADAWAAGFLRRVPASPRDCSAVDELLAAGRSATAAWLDSIGVDGIALDGIHGGGLSDADELIDPVAVVHPSEHHLR
jgi:predicted acylesterase/phospholipase RssA